MTHRQLAQGRRGDSVVRNRGFPTVRYGGRPLLVCNRLIPAAVLLSDERQVRELPR